MKLIMWDMIFVSVYLMYVGESKHNQFCICHKHRYEQGL